MDEMPHAALKAMMCAPSAVPSCSHQADSIVTTHPTRSTANSVSSETTANVEEAMAFLTKEDLSYSS